MVPSKLPSSWLSRMGTYHIQINGVTIDVKVVDRAALVSAELSQLKSLIGTTVAVGFKDLKLSPSDPAILQLCFGTRCLVILLTHLDYFPTSLKKFLNDHDVYFVGHRLSSGLSFLKSSHGVERGSGYIEVSELAARLLKKPNLWGSPLLTVAKELGFFGEYFSKSVPFVDWGAKVFSVDWGAKVFSVDEMKYAVQDVYACHLVGKKLLDMLN